MNIKKISFNFLIAILLIFCSFLVLLIGNGVRADITGPVTDDNSENFGLDGYRSEKCNVNWYSEAVIDLDLQPSYSQTGFVYNVANSVNPESKGYFQIQHWTEGTNLFWRIPLGTDYSLENGKIVIKFLDTTHKMDGYFEDLNVTAVSPGKPPYFQKFTGNLNYTTKVTIDPSNVHWSDDSLVIDIGDMPADSNIIFLIRSQPVDQEKEGNKYVAITRGDRFALSATFTANYNEDSGVKSCEKFDVTYNLGEHGTSDDPLLEEVLYEEYPVAVPSVEPNIAYEFLGWSIDGENIVDPTTTQIKEDVTFTAIYKIKSFTVNFLDDNDNIIKTEIVEYGNGATAPINPLKEDHTFTGWDKDFSNIIADLNIYAEFKKNEIEVDEETEEETKEETKAEVVNETEAKKKELPKTGGIALLLTGTSSLLAGTIIVKKFSNKNK